MGKIKRIRQKYHVAKAQARDADNNAVIPKQVPLVKKNTRQANTSSKGTGNIFAGIEINLGKDAGSSNSQDMDCTSVSSTSKQKPGPKKNRRKQRHEEFMKKIDVIKSAKKAEEARKKREKTKVVGDLHPMLNALPSLQELMAEANKQKTQKDKVQGGPKTQKETQKEFMSDIQMLMTVNNDKIFNDDPYGAVKMAIENRILMEKEDN